MEVEDLIIKNNPALQDQLTLNTETDYWNVKQASSLAAESAEANQFVPCSK